jgi:hypothetical protein
VDGGLDWWVLVPICPYLLYPLWIDGPDTCSGSSIIVYGFLFYLETLMHDWDPLSFCYKHAQTFLWSKSATALASKLSHLVYVPGTGPRCFCHNHTTQQHVNKYNNSRYVPVINVLSIVEDDHDNWLLLMSVGEMNKFTEMSKSPHFSSSAKRVH